MLLKEYLVKTSELLSKNLAGENVHNVQDVLHIHIDCALNKADEDGDIWSLLTVKKARVEFDTLSDRLISHLDGEGSNVNLFCINYKYKKDKRCRGGYSDIIESAELLLLPIMIDGSYKMDSSFLLDEDIADIGQVIRYHIAMELRRINKRRWMSLKKQMEELRDEDWSLREEAEAESYDNNKYYEANKLFEDL